jgi:hypothetical protein
MNVSLHPSSLLMSLCSPWLLVHFDTNNASINWALSKFFSYLSSKVLAQQLASSFLLTFRDCQVAMNLVS